MKAAIIETAICLAIGWAFIQLAILLKDFVHSY